MGAVKVHLAAGQSQGEVLSTLVDSEQVQMVTAPRKKASQQLLAPLPRAHDVNVLPRIKSPFPLGWSTPNPFQGTACGATGSHGSLVRVGGHRLAEVGEDHPRRVHGESLNHQAIVHDMEIKLAETILNNHKL